MHDLLLATLFVAMVIGPAISAWTVIAEEPNP
jgi:hypothetical protein